MKINWPNALAVTVFLLGIIGAIYMYALSKPRPNLSASRDPACNVIHEPTSGCPSVYLRAATPRFAERNGSKLFACISTDSRKQQCSDELGPGERVSVSVGFSQ